MRLRHVTLFLLLAVVPLGSADAAFTTIRASVAAPWPLGQTGPEWTVHVAKGCPSSVQPNGITQFILPAKYYVGKTLKITPTTVQADIPVGINPYPLTVTRMKSCTVESIVSVQSPLSCGPCVMKIADHVAVVITSSSGVHTNFKIECVSC